MAHSDGQRVVEIPVGDSLPGTPPVDRVTLAGRVHLKGFTSLKLLILSERQATDAGRVHLKGLWNLRWLMLKKTRVTDEGVPYL